MLEKMNKSHTHPFANTDFLKILENSGSIGGKTGWIPHHFRKNESLLPSYIKFHSYGEYIFDWSWANFYEKNRIPYYPKLLHAIPFTPVNAPKFLGNENDFESLAKESFQFYQTHNLSSEHYLFINSEEEKILNGLGFKTLFTHQYHFQNKYDSFEEFLDVLKKDKRKNIKKERRKIVESNLIIRKYQGRDLTKELMESFYFFYLKTIDKKMSYAYLTQFFFEQLVNMPVLLISAEKENQPIAMALFFYSDQVLYGRNWGILPQYEHEYPYLHFELCYYQGIDFCIENKIDLFEAGAQGEHKLLRGFEPVLIKSAHHIKIPQCFEIIKDDIERQNVQTLQTIDHLNNYLPFKIKFFV